MCSVSWSISPTGYEIYFNRDEQITRAQALPPRVTELAGVKVMMPIDPVGQGSWISTNDAGLSLCLLNNYQGKMPPPPLTSRGLLLSRLAKHIDTAEVEKALIKVELQEFAPFILLAFDLDLGKQENPVRAFHWNGENLWIDGMHSPVFSSAVELADVSEYRHQAYQDMVADNMDQALHLAFHCHHHKEQLYKSVCMHRDDAQTVSFTHVSVTSTEQHMSYVAGSPCRYLTPSSLANNRLTLSKQTAMSVAS
ncbi:NRDE family protein [Marinomonas sp. THO17]|uniref:NRDE family protein n=1 Tax=Marinomonas sp. THO17 TaxID=3149048 RepID=UPI00336C0C85